MSHNSGKSLLSNSENEKAVDTFRDTPLRYLGYANEVGEAFRPVVNEKWVWGSYGVASLYVLADALSKTVDLWKTEDPSTRMTESIKTGVDVLLWQSFASVIVPGFTINRICSLSNYLVRRSAMKKYSKPLTVAIGLGSIPFIIHPIDKGVDYAMNRSVRPIMRGI